MTISHHCTIPTNYNDKSIEVEKRFDTCTQITVLLFNSDLFSSQQTKQIINNLYDLSETEKFIGYFTLLKCMTTFLIDYNGVSEHRYLIWKTFQSSLYKNLQSRNDEPTESETVFKFLMVPIIINHEAVIFVD